MAIGAGSSWRAELDQANAHLMGQLGDNLYSCIAYGSAIRGEIIESESDINLLIVLQESTPQAHAVINDACQQWDRIQPFVLGKSGLARSQQVFALKFHSIKRNYRVLHGVDVLVEFDPSLPLLRFLVEQSLRNLRLRLNHAFITN
jgi:predicted nucleotidyltransferase